MPLVSPKLKLDFLRRQVLMSRNISGGPPISVFMGALTYQIRAPPGPLHGATATTQSAAARRRLLRRPRRPLHPHHAWQAYRIVIGYVNVVGLHGKDPFPCPPDRSTPRPLTLPIQLPALRARRSSFFLRWRRTHRISQSDRLIVELVDTGSTPVVILIRPQLSIARKRAGASFLIMTRLPLRSLTGLS
jgi:hypothetical protein